LRYDDPQCLALVVDELVRLKELLPGALPTLWIKPSEGHDPVHGIMCCGVWWPRPNRVWMEERHKSVGVACVPRSRLCVYHSLYLFLKRGHAGTPSLDAELGFQPQT